MKYIYKWPRLKMPRSIPMIIMIHTSLSEVIHTSDPYLTTTICTYTRPHLVYLQKIGLDQTSHIHLTRSNGPDHPKRTSTIVWVHGTAARLMLLWLIRMFVPRWDMSQIVFPIILFYNILYHITSMNMLNSTSRFKRMAFGLVAFFLTHTPCQIMQAEFDRGVHSIVTSDAYKTADLGSGWCCGHSRSREGHWA